MDRLIKRMDLIISNLLAPNRARQIAVDRRAPPAKTHSSSATDN
jgi:hypothetical protein